MNPARKGNISVSFLGENTDGYLLFTPQVGGCGVRLTTKQHLDRNKNYEMELLPEDPPLPIQVEARPVWQKHLDDPPDSYEAGFMFVKVSREDRETLVEYAKNQDRSRKKKDQRKHPRLPRILMAKLKEENAANFLQSLVLDISEGGAKALTWKLFPTGTTIQMEIEFGKETVCEMSGKIVWTKRLKAFEKYQKGIDCLHGIQFTFPKEELRDLIRHYVKFQMEFERIKLQDALAKIAEDAGNFRHNV